MKNLRSLGIILAVLVSFVVLWMMVYVSGGTLAGVFDLPTLGGLLLCFPALFVSGYSKDFRNAVMITFCDIDFSDKELERAEKSCTLLLKALWLESLLFTIIGLIGLCNNIDDHEFIGANIAVSLLPLLYGAFVSLGIIAVRGSVESKRCL